MGDEDFLDDIGSDKEPVEPVAQEPEPAKEPEPAAEPTKEPEPKPARDESGKFKAKEPEAAPEPEPVAAIQPEAPKQPDPGFVPLSAVLDERDRRQKLEGELAQLRAAQQPEEMPDPDRDPVGFANYQRAEFQKSILNERLNFSERFARKEHGAEAVEAAKQWAQTKFASDPLYVQQIYADADPYEKLVTDYRREQFFSQVSDPSELDEFRAWKAAKGQIAQTQAAPAATATPAPAIPPPSLASAPSAGSVLTEPEPTEEDIFKGAIP